jgi:hypothetical protein
MWLIADSGGIEQSDGSFLHQRTHTPDPELPFEIAPPQRLLRRCNHYSTNQAGRRAIGAL